MENHPQSVLHYHVTYLEYLGLSQLLRNGGIK